MEDTPFIVDKIMLQYGRILSIYPIMYEELSWRIRMGENRADVSYTSDKRICISGLLIYVIGMIACVFAKLVLQDVYRITCAIIFITIILFSIVMIKIKGDEDELKNRSILIYSGVMKLVFLFAITFENRLYSEEAINMDDNPLLFVAYIMATVSTTIEINMFIKNKKSSVLKKYIMGVSLLMYFLGVLLTNSFWVLLILVPIFAAYAQFNNVKLIIVGSVIANIIVVCGALTQIQYYDTNEFTTFESIPRIIKNILTDSIKDSSKYMMWIYIIIVTLLVIFSAALVSAAKTIKKFNNNKIEAIVSEQNRIQSIIEKISKIGMNIKLNTFNTNNIVAELNHSILDSGDKLDGILADTDNNIQIVEEQAKMNHNNFNLIDDVAKEMDKASISTEYVLRELERCKIAFDRLKSKSSSIYKNNEEVTKIIDEFVMNARRVSDIIYGISQISEETNLLSYNATVKSAKAGKEGKGFAVISGKIHNLANETSGITDKIGQIVEKLEKNAYVVQDVINEVVKDIDDENETIDETMDDFRNMENNIYLLSQDVFEISRNIDNISSFNHEIENHINTLNKSSVEVISNTRVATRINCEGESKVNQTQEMMDKILVLAERLEELCYRNQMMK